MNPFKPPFSNDSVEPVVSDSLGLYLICFGSASLANYASVEIALSSPAMSVIYRIVSLVLLPLLLIANAIAFASIAKWLVPIFSSEPRNLGRVLSASVLPPLFLLPILIVVPGITVVVFQLCILTVAAQIYLCRQVFKSACSDVALLGGLGFPCFAMGFILSLF